MDTITQLKESRSRAKAKLTSASRQLIGNTNLHNNDNLHSSLQQAYTDFIDVHYQFSEVVSESTDDSVGIVGGLGLDEYLDTALQVYNQAITMYADLMAQGLTLQANLSIEKAHFLIDLMEKGSRSASVFDDAESISFVCSDYHKQLLSVGFKGDLLSNLERAISALDVQVLRSRESRNSVSFNLAPDSDTLQSSTNILPHTNMHSHASVTAGSHIGEQRAGLSLSGVSDLPAGASGGGLSSDQSLRDSSPTIPPLDFSIVSAYEGLPRLPSLLTSSILPTNTGLGDNSQGQYPHRSKFKKSPPPTFSGIRREWAEFRAVWQRYGASEFTDNEQRAWALKGCLKGKALDCVKAIYVTQPNAYLRMWQRLDSIYSDVSLSVQAAYDELKKLKPVKEDDSKAFVKYVNDIESCYSQLGEVNQINSITMTHIDDLCDLLPISARKDWMRIFNSLSVDLKIHPFSSFMRFLESERDIASRLAERDSQRKDPATRHTRSTLQFQAKPFSSDVKPSQSSVKSDGMNCVIHNKPNIKHKTEQCTQFLSLSIPERVNALKKARACFKCFGLHLRVECRSTHVCSVCSTDTHHTLLCRDSVPSSVSTNKVSSENTTSSFHSDILRSDTVYPIQQVPVAGIKRRATVFYDGGSNATFISEQATQKLKAERLNKVDLNLITMGNKESHYSTFLYQVKLLQVDGSVATVQAYGIPEIMGEVKRLDAEFIQSLFPRYPTQYLPDSALVDMLIGNDYYGLHPKKELNRAGDHLSVMEGPLGTCIQGSHPDLGYGVISSTRPTYNQSFHIQTVSQHTHVEFSEDRLHLCKRGKSESFITGEELGTEVVPRCGGCKCSKCPVSGHTFSFHEERELDMIREILKYDSVGQRWVTSYPWISNPTDLPKNYNSALATLKSTERRLRNDSKWGEIYQSQIEDMVTRKVARKLSEEEIGKWEGPIFYISHLAVVNPKSSTTPVRIVFNSSQKFHGMSLNSFLAKGPDSYLNNLLGILLRWREEKVVMVSDIRKMYNSIFVTEVEQHCHRFLWRDLEEREPDIYVIQRVNMGDKPAAAISTEAIYKTADMFQEDYPQVQELLRRSTYVDDIVHSVATVEMARQLSKDTEEILNRAGFTLKGWIFNETSLQPDSETDQQHRILGLQWEPGEDVIKYEAKLNFSTKKNGVYSGSNLSQSEVPSSIPSKLTRRIVLEQVMKVYDPLGILSPFTLEAKILLRKTWELKLAWDDPLPPGLHSLWIEFFTELFGISKLRFDRCLSPSDKEGTPLLIILSDASDVAYGASAYVRWQLQNGGFWSRLIMAKCRIAPQRRLSTPQMELNGAVLSKRIRRVLEQEHRIKFSKVYHLLDSETVLNMINKLSTRFKLYEGVRIGEIQAASDGNMEEWFWIAGKDNIADWITRSKKPSELGPNSEWWCGPTFLSQPEEEWPIKKHSDCHSSTDLPGEKKPVIVLSAEVRAAIIDYERFSSMTKLTWTMARVRGIARERSFKGGHTDSISVEDLREAERMIIKDVQLDISSADTKKNGKYYKLTPTRDLEGIWVVGRRVSEYKSTLTESANLPALLPPTHWVTRLLMTHAHVKGGHRGRDSTLARFRYQYWTPRGAKLARSVRNDCQLCRLRNPQQFTPVMGILPSDRMRPSPPFNGVMLDLFGPYLIRGEIQKRVTGKAYGVLFTDLSSRAIHIEGVFGYDTASFLMAFTRFVSIRGWPQVVYSDPGSQLVGSSKELINMWDRMEREDIYKLSTEQGTTWRFGPADSPWEQGAVEALVKAVKRCFRFTFGEQRLSAAEFLTVCAQASSLLNERPLAVLSDEDEGISVLTPNCQLIGRPYTQNPGWWKTEGSIRKRLEIVEQLADTFWKRWTEAYLPTLIKQQKWFRNECDVRVGDVVVVSDANALRGKYYIALVSEVFPGKDGVIRKVALQYKTFKVGGKVHEYKGARGVTVLRSVRRLAPLVKVGREDTPESEGSCPPAQV